jgi:predicted small metal-binding protein
MTKSISCADVGVTDCQWSATAETEEELMAKCQSHAKEHGFEQVPPEMLAKIKGAIKEK